MFAVNSVTPTYSNYEFAVLGVKLLIVHFPQSLIHPIVASPFLGQN
jgi:hypothetical protein